MAVLYTPHFMQFFDNNGLPLSGGKLYSYVAGTTTPKATYTTALGNIEHANPIILDSSGRATLFLVGSYKFTLTDADDVLIRTTDNVTAFTAATDTEEGFYQAFSGDGDTTTFTLTDNLGTDEKALFIFAENEYSINGTFSEDADWTKGTGWTIGSGVATATGAISTSLAQSAGITLIEGKSYSVKYTITRTAGSLILSLGGTNGASRSASGTYSETIIAGTTQTISFDATGFTGTVDNLSIRDVTGPVNIPPTRYTIDGVTLSFNTAPASGTNNISVYAPYTLIGAAGAAQVAADDAIAAAALAEAAKDDAVAAEAATVNISATSTTSLAIGTGEKIFTIQAGRGFIAGAWVLVTSDADPTNYMHGSVTSYSGTTLTLDITNIGGSGTLDDWTIRISGTRGAVGATGSISDLSGVPSGTIEPDDTLIFTDINDSNTTKKTTFSAFATTVRGYIDGFIMSTAGSSATMTIGAGQATNSTNAAYITLASDLDKTTSAWAVGDTNGGLDTGTIANNTWYRFYAIRRPDTGVVDVIFSANASSPALPTNYTQYAPLWWGRTNGSAQWEEVQQKGNKFTFKNAKKSSGVIINTTRTLLTIDAPPLTDATIYINTGVASAAYTLLQETYETDYSPSISDLSYNSYPSLLNGGQFILGLDELRQIAGRSSVAVTGVVNVTSWVDRRV